MNACLREALNGKLSTYATRLRTQNDCYRAGDSEGAGQWSANIDTAALEVTAAKTALEDHKELKHRLGAR